MRVLITGGEGYIGSNLAQLVDCEQYDVTNGHDVLNRSQLERAIIKYDIMVHLAAISGIQPCDKVPPIAVVENIIGTKNVAELCKLHNKKMVFASSQAVHKQSMYGLTKLIGERIVSYYGGVSLRFSNVWGGLDYLKLKDSAIARLNKCTFEDRGHGEELRDFIHVDDVCKGIVAAFNYDSGVYDLKSGISISINELIERFHGGEFRC